MNTSTPIKRLIGSASGVLLGALFLGTSAFAQAPAGAPAGSTGLCKDGSYYSGETKRGACKGHGGVKDWYLAKDATKAADKAPAKAPETAKATTPAPSPTPATAIAPAAPAAAAKPARTPPQPAAVAAAGGGPGKVWVNEASKVYHCSDDRWYGKTKQGEYMSEADAKGKGMHGVRGKSCAS